MPISQKLPPNPSSLQLLFAIVGCIGVYFFSVRLLFLYAKAKFKTKKTLGYFFWFYFLIVYFSRTLQQMAANLNLKLYEKIAAQYETLIYPSLWISFFIISALFLLGCCYMVMPREKLDEPESFLAVIWKYLLLPAILMASLSFLAFLFNGFDLISLSLGALSRITDVLFAIFSLELLYRSYTDL